MAHKWRVREGDAKHILKRDGEREAGTNGEQARKDEADQGPHQTTAKEDIFCAHESPFEKARWALEAHGEARPIGRGTHSESLGGLIALFLPNSLDSPRDYPGRALIIHLPSEYLHRMSMMKSLPSRLLVFN